MASCISYGPCPAWRSNFIYVIDKALGGGLNLNTSLHFMYDIPRYGIESYWKADATLTYRPALLYLACWDRVGVLC